MVGIAFHANDLFNLSLCIMDIAYYIDMAHSLNKEFSVAVCVVIGPTVHNLYIICVL